jgi:hypothetical protein
MHPTAACEELKTYVDFIGYVSSSECVYLTWYNYGSNATHAEKFWIFETENEDACDLLIANRPISGEPGKWMGAAKSTQNDANNIVLLHSSKPSAS